MIRSLAIALIVAAQLAEGAVRAAPPQAPTVMIGVPPPRLRELLAAEEDLEGCRFRLDGERRMVAICEAERDETTARMDAALEAERRAKTPPPPPSWSWESFAWGALVGALIAGVAVAGVAVSVPSR